MASERDERLWSAIADPSRRRLLDLLVEDGVATASSLAERVPFTRQAVSKHLAILEEAGLLLRHKHGREVRYHVAPARLDDATRAIIELARSWDRRLSGIKRIAEAEHRHRTDD
jgi:ArsR family transcriptional regulator, cadmium/lead-responsive transcriptional repressor